MLNSKLEGLSYNEARSRLLSIIIDCSSRERVEFWDEIFKIELNDLILLVTVIIFLICSIVSDGLYAQDLLWSYVLLMVIGICGWVMGNGVDVILKNEKAYRLSCLYHSTNHLLSSLTTMSVEEEAEGSGGLLFGHPHTSVYSVLRGGRWSRLPSLLLVEGDLISTMPG